MKLFLAGRSFDWLAGRKLLLFFIFLPFVFRASCPAAAGSLELKYYDGGKEVDAFYLIDQIPPQVRAAWQAWIDRLDELSKGRATPVVWFKQSIAVPAGRIPGVSYPLPVLRIVFNEQSFFEFNKADVLPSALPALKLIVDLLRTSKPTPYVLIVGHTDNVGTFEMNERLSGRRAEAAMALFLSLGADSKHLHRAAMGRRQSYVKNDTAQGRAINRRIEVMISVSPAANIEAVQQIPGVADDPLTSSAEQPQPHTGVEVRDRDGNVTGTIFVRPPREIPLRKFD